MKKQVRKEYKTRRPPNEGYVTLAEAAEILNVAKQTVLAMVRAGLISTCKSRPDNVRASGYSQADIARVARGYQQAVANVWNSQPRA